jgi:C_GCAxxG_C_C family probable redox protein
MEKTYPIRKALEADLPSILLLLQQSSLPTEDIPRENQFFWVVEKDREIAGVIGIENYGRSGLLRSFVVHPSCRRQSIGASLLQHAIKEADKLGVESLFLCTNTAAGYFEKHHWIYIRRESVSEEIRQSEEFNCEWPDSTLCMYLPLREGAVKNAVETYLAGFNCAQAVFSSFAPAMGLSAKESLKIASGFGAGICYKGEICGAVSGAYMALGLKYGRWQSEDAEAREKTYALMREFDRQFIARNGSLYCNRLLEGDMSTPEGRKKIHESHRFKTHCPRFVKDAAEIAERLMES